LSRTADVDGYVLAGGASSRFGRDKAKAEIEGKPMLVRMCDLLRTSGLPRVTVIGPPKKYRKFDIPCVRDRWPGEGPLGGIITALLHAGTVSPYRRHIVVVSCDMPFLTNEWVKSLVGRAIANDASVTLPQSDRGFEPLCACYRSDALQPLRSAFDSGVRKITDALKILRTEVLDEKEWKRFDSSGRLFWNMNTVADYEEARRVIAAEKT